MINNKTWPLWVVPWDILRIRVKWDINNHKRLAAALLALSKRLTTTRTADITVTTDTKVTTNNLMAAINNLLLTVAISLLHHTASHRLLNMADISNLLRNLTTPKLKQHPLMMMQAKPNHSSINLVHQHQCWT